MKQFTTTARSYQIFNQIAHALKASLAKKIPNAFGFSGEQLANRLTQRVVALGLAPFMQLSGSGKVEHPFSGNDVLPLQTVTLTGGAEHWRIAVSPYFLLKNLVDYYVHVFCNVCVLLYAATVAKVKSGRQPATLVFGLGMESLDPQHGYIAFIDFCKQSEITVLNNASRLLLHTSQKPLPSACGYLNFHRFPLYALMAETPLSMTSLVQATCKVLKNLAEFHIFLIKYPEASLLSRELAMLPLIEILNAEKMIEAVVLTNSIYDAQPLWLRPFQGRDFEAHMIFYSQNVIPFVYKDYPHAVPLPNNLLLFSDHYWIWNEAFKTYLQTDLGLTGRFHVVGPVVWYLNKQVEASKQTASDTYQVTIFDVTPVNKDYSEQIGLIDNYYSSLNCRQFIEHIVEVVDNINKHFGKVVHLNIKHKRGHRDIHDAAYVQFIDQLVASGRLVYVSHTANLFELVRNSDFVIVMPYSSPTVIADYLNVPTVNYDPSNRLLVDIVGRNGASKVISNKDQLFQKIAETLKPELH